MLRKFGRIIFQKFYCFRKIDPVMIPSPATNAGQRIKTVSVGKEDQA
jgi:hypothetical protein